MALTLLSLFVACTCGPEPQAVVVRGVLRTSGGQALAGETLALEQVRSCRILRQVVASTPVTTDGVGAWAHALTPTELTLTSGSGGLDCLRVRYDGAEGTQALAALLVVPFDAGPGVTTLSGPALVAWSNAPTLSTSGSTQRVVFDESGLPDDADGTPRAFVWLATGDGGLIWTSGEVPAASMSFSAQVLEDFPAPVAQATALRRWRAVPLVADVELTSRPFAVDGGALVPPSRGAACSWPDAGPCPFTDGALTSREPRNLEHLDFTLARSLPLRRAVVRGLYFFPTLEGFGSGELLLVEGRVDGGWSPLGSTPAASGSTSFALSGEAVDVVRVRLATGSGKPVPISALSEVSFFE